MIAPRAVLLAVVLLGALSACTAPTASQGSVEQEQTDAPTPTATSEPTAAAYDPEGGAAGNKEYFRSVTRALLNDDPTPTGRKLIDNLVDAGFDKSTMELTPDKTSIGLDADAIEFSVQFGDECLIGQQASFGLTVIVADVLDSGTCLVGTTRDIDW